MRAAVVVFPGSNCDRDTAHVLREVLGFETDMVWHTETDLSRHDLVVLPGGFSHGDYLRTGAIAARAPVMRSVAAAAARGVPILGICNGFQVLTEAGLLPGALLRNAGLGFRCEWLHVRVETAATPFTSAAAPGQLLRLPIAHGEGNYQAAPEVLERLEGEGRVVFRYSDSDGRIVAEANPNGSLGNIAGICSEGRNVVGLMPHPERAAERHLGSEDGRLLWASLMAAVAA